MWQNLCCRFLGLVHLLVFVSNIHPAVSDNPLDVLKNEFSIIRPFSPAVGSEDFVFCKLREGYEPLDCTFITPLGETWTVNNDSVQNNEGENIENVQPLMEYEDEHGCGLKFLNFNAEHFGWWTCHMDDEFESDFHKGTFKINDVNDYPKDIKLPSHMKAMEYDIELTPNFITFTTKGFVKMRLQFTKNPNQHSAYDGYNITLHAHQLIIDEESVFIESEDTEEEEIFPIGHEYDLDRQFYIIHLDKPLKDETIYEISINFTSILNDDLSGFYRSSYIEDGVTKYLAVTQHESTGARKSFPCLDEPDKKANFIIKLGHTKDMIARSNMKRNSTIPHPDDPENMVIDIFNPSVPMSTYLSAFMVADFGHTTNEDDENYNIFHIKSKAEQAKYAASIGPSILEFYESYFNLPYPLPKMDMAAIPDFGAGAMENWGLITYRETLLLFDEKMSAITNKESIASVMAHELAHQWFGNIVTMKWWTDLWLNEGFAVYVANLGIGSVLPEAKMRERVLYMDCQSVMGIDALESSHPILHEVLNPTFDVKFDKITYDKGGCMLRMMEKFMTEEKLQLGVSNYLRKFRFSNAETQDLWESLNEVYTDGSSQNLTISEIMESWTKNPGFPVVHFDGKTLKQKRFLLNTNANPDSTLWHVPISIYYPRNETSKPTTIPEYWFKTYNTTSFAAAERPFIVNTKSSAFYRINYDHENWRELSSLLKTPGMMENIDKMNRAQLVDDAMNLARADQLPYTIALDLLKYLPHESEFIPWESGLNALDFLYTRFQTNETKLNSLEHFIKDMLENRYESLGFKSNSNDDYMTILSRNSISSWMCKVNFTNCVENALDLFQKWVENDDDQESISANIKDVVYNTAIRFGPSTYWEFMFDKFNSSNIIDSERLKYIYAMAATEDSTLIQRYLNLAVDRMNPGNPIRTQDCIYIFRTISHTRIGRTVALDYWINNYDKMKESFGVNTNRYLLETLTGYASTANTKAEVEKMENFVENHKADLQSRMGDIQNCYKTAELNVVWNDLNSEEVIQWINEEISDDDDENVSSNLSASLWSLTIAILISVKFY